ncbi:hypothetical protein N2152v2_002778 [Parachlorella kessleri]
MARSSIKTWPVALALLACLAGAARADGSELGVTSTDPTVKQGDTKADNFHDCFVRGCDASVAGEQKVEAATLPSPSPAYDDAHYSSLKTWFNWNPRYDYLYQYLSANHPEVLSGDYPVTIFVPIGSNKTWEDAGWPLSLPPAFYPRLVVPYVYKSYEELVEAGSVTTYNNTIINFSYNQYEEVLGEWQDKTQAKAYVDYAVYPYGKSVIYAIRPYSWAPRPSPSPVASPDYTSPSPVPSPAYESPSPVPTPGYGYRRLRL